MRAWHFVGERLRDGRPVPPDGEVLRHDGELVMCDSGLHASVKILDALDYAPGSTICRVEVGGEIEEGDDKLVASERTILWRIEGGEVLRAFARRCALDVIHLWDAPEIVKHYLETGDEETGDEKLRDAARDAAGAAARAAAWAAARDAAENAAWAAARDAAGDAAWNAAWDKYNEWLEEMVIAERKRKLEDLITNLLGKDGENEIGEIEL